MGLRRIVLGLLFELGIGGHALGQSPPGHPHTAEPLREILALVDTVRTESFPQLKGVDIALHPMRSDYIYFESRFTLSSFFFARKLRYSIRFNPELIGREVPADGLRAIVAHELAHIDYFHRRRRIALVSLVRLLSAPFTARFERGADLEAIARGYGPGLKSYRTWLYRNVPAGKIEIKERDYFSPEEIEAILRAVAQNPEIMRDFSACVPGSLAEVERESMNTGARFPR